MTFEPPDAGPATLVTTRVGSGRSARLMALVVAAVLVSVVGYAFINRPLPPAPAMALGSATPAPPATRPPTAALTASPPRNQLEGNDGMFGWLVPPIQRYAVAMDITGGRLRLILEPDLAGVFSGSLVIESAFVGAELGVELGLQQDQRGVSFFEQFGAWDVALKQLGKPRAGLVPLLMVHEPPRTTTFGHGSSANGYTFTVLGRREGRRMTLSFELVVGQSSG